jgi:hypothetical protein
MAMQGRGPRAIGCGCLAEEPEKRQHGAPIDNLPKITCQETTWVIPA